MQRTLADAWAYAIVGHRSAHSQTLGLMQLWARCHESGVLSQLCVQRRRNCVSSLSPVTHDLRMLLGLCCVCRCCWQR
jgi:hypothetical protein